MVLPAEALAEIAFNNAIGERKFRRQFAVVVERQKAKHKARDVKEHGSHDQKSHGRGGGSVEAEGSTKHTSLSEALTDQEHRSIYNYATGSYESINDTLAGRRESNAQIEKNIAGIDGAMAKSTLKSDMQVHRGMVASNERAEQLQTPGAEFTMKGYGSTSQDARIARNFASKAKTLYEDRGKPNSVILTINAKKGQHALDLTGSDKLGPRTEFNEFEILMPKSQSYRVVSSKRSRKRNIDLEVTVDAI